MTCALVFSGVSKVYDNVIALRGVSLEIEENEVFTLLGPNGAGKSTLLKIAVGLIKPTEGSVRVLGIDVLREPQRVKEVVGYVPQESIVYDEMKGLENLRFYASLYGMPKEVAEDRIGKYVSLLGLSNYINRRVRTYSGGLKKKLSIAAPLFTTPRY